MIDQPTIQKIMDAARIEEVVGEFVSLKKRGANHIGCCPFHNEKTPSFYVSPSKGIYKCFGCGEAGDVVAFLKKHEHYTYPEALRWLAAKYNIAIAEEPMTDEERQRQTERDALFHVSEFAQKYFANLLYNNEMGRAVGLSYFHSRGLSDEVIKRFGLGYCLDEWSAFTDHALRSGYSDAVLEKTGLTIHKEDTGRRYDRFRGRVMFPIYSISGRVLGFSGRVLSSEKQAAKYVNSPDSDIYNKSHTLYGLFQARTAISRANKCYLVEGNVDVISMHQSGVENTVASCGTSLTVEQIRLIKRYTPNVTVLYDGDAAGIKAALRAIDLLLAEDMHVRLVLFPDGEDPDSYAQKYGSTKLQEYLATHEDNFILFKTRVQLEAAGGDPIRKAELLAETARTIALVGDMLERAEYVRQCSQMLHVSEDVLGSAVAKAGLAARTKAREEAKRTANADTPTPPDPQADPTTQTAQPAEPEPPKPPQGQFGQPSPVERHIAQLLLSYGNEELVQTTQAPDGTPTEQRFTVAQAIVSELRANGLTLSNTLCQRIYEQCALMLDMAGRVDDRRFVESGDEQLRAFAAALMLDGYSLSDTWHRKGIYAPSIEDNLLRDVTDTVNTLKAAWVAQMIATRREALRGADAARQEQLLAEIQQYQAIGRQIGSARGIVINPRY